MADRGGEKGRASRASSTSSLGREVRCGCQFYQSDSLLPERKAMIGRPSSRTAMQTPPPMVSGHTVQGARCEHEYEPIGTPALVMARSNASTPGTTAPVVRINDTDVVHVADSDESIDAQERRLYTSNKLVLDGDIVVPLDGEIEDNAMQARELGDNGDTSEDQETPQQLQDRLEERFLNAATPCTESRTDAEINTSQVDSSALEELPLRRGARGFPQRLRSQAGKLRSRLRGIQRPSFSLPERQKTDNKTKTTKVEKPKVAKPKSEKSRFSLPDRPKFSMPERPKFNFPDRAKFSMPERPKFNIKRPNINLPTLGRVRKPLKERQNSSESNSSAKRNIFDFSTYPRLFDKKSKNRGEYATSSPKASRGQSPEVATVPRVKKKAPIGARWVQKFSDLKFADDEPESAVERSKPWRHPSIEEPQVAFRREATESRERLPWEESDDRSIEPPAPPLPLPDEIADEESCEERANRDREEDEDVDYEEDSADIENRRIIVALPLGHGLLPSPEEELAAHVVEEVPDPRLYPRGLRGDSLDEEMRRRGAKEKWQHESDEEITGERAEKEEVGERDPYGHDEYSGEMVPGDSYGRGFMPIDPPMKYVLEREQTPEDSSMRSDREQQSSGSSCDRRRRGVLEEIDSDEFFLRAKGISQDDMNLGRFLASEIRDAFRPTPNALADQELDLRPPTRPVRTRSLRKKRWDETPPESHNATPPARPKRDRRRSEDSVRVEEYESYLPEKAGSVSGSRHRVMYQTEAVPRADEPLDDIVVVKPARRKSRSVARSCSDLGSDALPPLPTPPTPPVAPRRRKRGRRNFGANGNGPYLNGHGPTTTVCNGHRRDVEWPEGIDYPPEVSNEPENLNREQLQTLVNRLDHEYIEPAPIAPKRRSRSRGTSVADDDRTSRGAESLPEVSYLDEEDAAGQETDSRDLPGYAVVDKREKPPRPPPPRRRREKFATSPRTPPSTAIPTVPVRPTRAYSTLGPAARRRSPSEDRSVNQMDVTPYTELDSDDPDCNELQSGQVLNKIQGRPLPAPPRPPRSRRDAPDQVSTISNGLGEVAASTQTDPLPDDVVIEEEVTRARLVMTPSRAGSQVLVSTERVATPTFGRNSPAVPPLPQSVHSERFAEPSEEAETGTPDPRGPEERPDRPVTPARPASSLLLQHDDRIRIASLEVGDLKVERLNVSQLEAHKISASEVDAIVISASEMSNNSNMSNAEDGGIHPSLLRELIAIRSHLEQAALARQGREPTPESSRVQTIDEKVKDQPLSAVDELIEALKKSDRSDEGTEIMEESERIDEQVETNDEKTLFEALKPIEEDQSISKTETVQEVSQRDESKTEVTEDTKVCNESPASVDIMAVKPDDKTPEKAPEVESTSDSVSTVKTASVESALSPPIIENLEPAKASAPPNLSEPNTVSSLNTDQEEIRIQGQSSLRDESKYEKRKCPRSRSSSPTIDGKKAVRQTASPVKSLPPLISVTPDTPDPVPSPVPEVQAQPQRATVSYTQSIDEEVSLRQQVAGVTQFVAFPTSQIPANFFSLASPIDSRYESEPSIMDMTQQLLRALRLAGTRAMRHFVGYVASRVSTEDRGEKIKEIELAICALLLLIAGLLILCFGSPRTVTHHHHWDYFNPPQ